MNEVKQHWISQILLTMMLVVGLFWSAIPAANAAPSDCEGLGITGSYTCNVACVLREEGKLSSFSNFFHSETDTITTFTSDAIEDWYGFYDVNIVSGDFTEREIGPMVGCTLYTATESVSDDQFPVLEEYIFENGSGEANGFFKVVRNPSKPNFKTCKVYCSK